MAGKKKIECLTYRNSEKFSLLGKKIIVKTNNKDSYNKKDLEDKKKKGINERISKTLISNQIESKDLRKSLNNLVSNKSLEIIEEVKISKKICEFCEKSIFKKIFQTPKCKICYFCEACLKNFEMYKEKLNTCLDCSSYFQKFLFKNCRNSRCELCVNPISNLKFLCQKHAYCLECYNFIENNDFSHIRIINSCRQCQDFLKKIIPYQAQLTDQTKNLNGILQINYVKENKALALNNYQEPRKSNENKKNHLILFDSIKSQPVEKWEKNLDYTKFNSNTSQINKKLNDKKSPKKETGSPEKVPKNARVSDKYQDNKIDLKQKSSNTDLFFIPNGKKSPETIIKETGNPQKVPENIFFNDSYQNNKIDLKQKSSNTNQIFILNEKKSPEMTKKEAGSPEKVPENASDKYQDSQINLIKPRENTNLIYWPTENKSPEITKKDILGKATENMSSFFNPTPLNTQLHMPQNYQKHSQINQILPIDQTAQYTVDTFHLRAMNYKPLCTICNSQKPLVAFLCNHNVCFDCLIFNCWVDIKNFISSFSMNNDKIFEKFSYHCPLSFCRKNISIPTKMITNRLKNLLTRLDSNDLSYYNYIATNTNWIPYFDGLDPYLVFNLDKL